MAGAIQKKLVTRKCESSVGCLNLYDEFAFFPSCVFSAIGYCVFVLF